MNEYHPPQELVELAAQLADEDLDDNRLETLRGIVACDRAGAAWLVDWLELNAMLQLDIGSQSQFPMVPAALLPSKSGRPAVACDCAEPEKSGLRAVNFQSLRWKPWLAMATAVLLLVSYALGFVTPTFLRHDSASSMDPQPALLAEKTIATIAAGVDVEFGDGLTLGSRVAPGRLQLKRGVAQLVFDRGAVVVLEGPAELFLIDSGTCRLVSGSISADVLPESGEFNVGVGDFSIMETDARFGLRTSPDEDSEVHVFGGELNLVNYGGTIAQARHLKEGQALRFGGNEVATGMDSDPTSFVTRQELARRHRLNEKLAHARWVEYSKRWLDDPSVMIRYEFGPTADGVIVNTVDADRHSAKYRRSSPRWISGRWSDKQTMLFDGRTDVLDVADHPDLRLQRQLSLAIWFQARSHSWGPWTRLAGKGRGADRNYGLWVDMDGELLWQVCPDKDPESQEVWDRYSLEAGVLPVGQWCLAVGVVDEDQLRVYVNGELRASGPAPETIANSNDPLTIGFYDDVPHHNTYFCGELDELILLNRVLSEDEIAEMYEAGRPEYIPTPGTPANEMGTEAQLKYSI